MHRNVYAVLDKAGVVRYVGKTSGTIANRFAQHHRVALRGSHLPFLRWLAKHPEATIIALESDCTDLNAAEQKWIAYYGLDNLLNICPGGNGGVIPGNAANKGVPRRKNTPEQIERWRASRAVNEWKRMRSPDFYTAEAKVRRSEGARKAIVTRRTRNVSI